MRVSFASYLECRNLEDRVEISPDAARFSDDRRAAPAPPTDAPPRSEPNPSDPARLAEVLPVSSPPRRVEVETAYRLRVATTRPSGVLDVMG